MKKVITYGTYDLFHQGHYNLLKRAKDLGDYLIVGVTTDSFDLERGKLNVCNNLMERIESVRATGLADQIIIEEYTGQKIDDIKKYDADIFAIGSDWEGKFDYLNEFCRVVYLPRTQGISSTQLREERPTVRLGLIGTGNIALRFLKEAEFVNSIKIVGAYNPDKIECDSFCESNGLTGSYHSLEDFLGYVDAVYIASPHLTHPFYTRNALLAGKHVLCETPFSFSRMDAEELLHLAYDRSLVLMVGLKTAYCPAFGHLITILKSGKIGEIVDVSASVTSLLDENSDKLDASKGGGSMSENACFPLLAIFKLLGTDYMDVRFYSKIRNETDIFTKGIIHYPSSLGTFGVGLGVKSEGSLIISGTKGNAYVPAPWWKTDYFELRYEDINQNKKFFYSYEGDGLRYEIKEFVSCIINHTNPYVKLNQNEIVAMADIQERFLNHKGLIKI